MSVSSIGSFSAYGSLFQDSSLANGSSNSSASTAASGQSSSTGSSSSSGSNAPGTSGLGATGALLSTLSSTPSIASSTGTNWLSEAQNAEASDTGGLLGMLAAGSDGSLTTFLNNSQTMSDAFASISQDSTTATSQFANQEAQANAQAQAPQNQLAALLNPPGATDQTNFTPPAQLDPNIYFPDGSSLDTVGNVLTRNDGTQIDITTGLPILNPQTTLMLANGAYIDTANNVLHESNGQAIDMYTGLPEANTTAIATSDASSATDTSSTEPGSTVSVTA